MCECMSVHVLDWVGGVKLSVIVTCVKEYMSDCMQWSLSVIVRVYVISSVRAC